MAGIAAFEGLGQHRSGEVGDNRPMMTAIPVTVSCPPPCVYFSRMFLDKKAKVLQYEYPIFNLQGFYYGDSTTS